MVCNQFSVKNNKFGVKNNSTLTLESNKKTINLDKNFINWLVGFTDAKGNFNISLKGLQDNKYNSLNITFQITLHIKLINEHCDLFVKVYSTTILILKINKLIILFYWKFG
jgi:hypothetical protein